MPNHIATAKRLKQDAKRHLRNITTKSRLRTLVKKVREAAQAKQTETAKTQLQEAISALDKAAKRHIIHPRNAARRKSRLMLLVNSLGKS